mmetsp:Transcript_60296/g.143671  ORF Transcript_60296/g.143671 Transcript_60296/m.143671 type:complete len:102 (-) Transcript_60296:127-432(-)
MGAMMVALQDGICSCGSSRHPDQEPAPVLALNDSHLSSTNGSLSGAKRWQPSGLDSWNPYQVFASQRWSGSGTKDTLPPLESRVSLAPATTREVLPAPKTQ